MNLSLENANKAFDDGELEKSREALNQIIETDSANLEALILRAKVFYNLQKWGEALNDLNRVLEIDSENQHAKNYKEMVMNILSFWHKDNYNP